MRQRRPGIYQTGKVTDDGETVVITGWGLSLCMDGCVCHRNPDSGHLAIFEDQQQGLLGLQKNRPCGCCWPWTAAELAAVVEELKFLEDPDSIVV